jgi:hypothetical protein
MQQPVSDVWSVRQGLKVDRQRKLQVWLESSAEGIGGR